MIKELIILSIIIIFIIAVQIIDSSFLSQFNIIEINNIPIFKSDILSTAILIVSAYFILLFFRLFFSMIRNWLFETRDEEDIEFVHTLYAQGNARISKYAYILLFTICLFFTSAILWSYYSEIDELTRGEGKVIPSVKIQTIQSLDGGVVSEILVKEGFIIKKGQPLMKIDTTRFKASLDENKNTLESLLASQIRLTAEMNINIKKPRPKLNFSNKNLTKYPDIIKVQKELFKTRYEELKANINTLNIQVKQKEQELKELQSKQEQLWQSIKLIKEEMATIENLVAKKVRPNIDLISIKREYNEILGDYMATKLSIPRAKFSIEESNNKVVEKIKMFKNEAAEELHRINNEIKKYQSKVISEKDKLDKTVIVSPVNGIINRIHINTIGGVVRSGADLIEIVPESETLLIEAKIDPKDIAFINPSQKAIVKITAYDFSIYGSLEGKIVEISADSIKDEDSREGKTYYKVTIKTEKNYLEKDGERYSIIPGMIASVDIVTGKKTILEFILKPIIKTKDSALHER